MIMQQIITIPVRKKVAKLELTFFIPILAKIVVSDVNKAARRASTNHNIISIPQLHLHYRINK